MSSLVMVMADPLSFGQSYLATGVRQGPTCGRFWRLGDCATGYAEEIPGDLIAPLLPAYQDLANGSDFHYDVLSLSFQSLPCALWECGAHVVRAATPL